VTKLLLYDAASADPYAALLSGYDDIRSDITLDVGVNWPNQFNIICEVSDSAVTKVIYTGQIYVSNNPRVRTQAPYKVFIDGGWEGRRDSLTDEMDFFITATPYKGSVPGTPLVAKLTVNIVP
jgi:hypothetical protein